MGTLRSCLTFLILIAASGISALAQSGGDPQRGLNIALQQCADCHLVERGLGRSPVPAAPNFESIANIPGMTDMALTAALRTPHRLMPDFIIKRTDIGDLVAYILSLKNGGPR